MKWLNSVGLISSPSSNDIGLLTGWTPVGPCNKVPDPEPALKDFTVQVHQQSHHNSIKHYVWLAHNQKLQTLWFSMDWCGTLLLVGLESTAIPSWWHLGTQSTWDILIEHCRLKAHNLIGSRWGVFFLCLFGLYAILYNNRATWRCVSGFHDGINRKWLHWKIKLRKYYLGN